MFRRTSRSRQSAASAELLERQQYIEVADEPILVQVERFAVGSRPPLRADSRAQSVQIAERHAAVAVEIRATLRRWLGLGAAGGVGVAVQVLGVGWAGVLEVGDAVAVAVFDFGAAVGVGVAVQVLGVGRASVLEILDTVSVGVVEFGTAVVIVVAVGVLGLVRAGVEE